MEERNGDFIDGKKYPANENREWTMHLRFAKHVFKETGKIHTPELTTQGVTAKAWVENLGKNYLYKIGKKELAASAILDSLGFRHVKYEKVQGEELENVVRS